MGSFLAWLLTLLACARELCRGRVDDSSRRRHSVIPTRTAQNIKAGATQSLVQLAIRVACQL